MEAWQLQSAYRNRRREPVREVPEIVGIRRQDRCRCFGSSDNHMRIHDVGSADPAQERPDLMALLWSEADDVAATQKAPKLYLPRRAADLGNDG